MMQFLSAHWGVVSIVVYSIINLLNSLTEHWKRSNGAIPRWVLFVSELLSFVSSKGAANPFKLPGKV
jgi:hypothetical protein